MSSLPPLPPLPPPPSNTSALLRARLFLAAMVLFAVLLLLTDFVPVLDHFNLAMHEAGHLLFAILGNTASLYGGTLMQFVFPAAVTVHFWRRGQPLSAAAGVVWGLQNLQYVALYLGDARARQLPLVGGGEHDWFNILGRWGLLEWDTRIAGLLEFGSWVGLCAVAAWVAGQARAPRTRRRGGRRR